MNIDEIKKIKGPGTYKLDCRHLDGQVTLFLGGEMGNAVITPYAEAGQITCPVADGGPIYGEETNGKPATVDNFNVPVRRVIYGGDMDYLVLVVTQASTTNMEATVR